MGKIWGKCVVVLLLGNYSLELLAFEKRLSSRPFWDTVLNGAVRNSYYLRETHLIEPEEKNQPQLRKHLRRHISQAKEDCYAQ